MPSEPHDPVPTSGSQPIAQAPRPVARGPYWIAFALLAGLVLGFAVVVVRTAWLSEDAYFTFRSVENWVYGYGARWNVAERVQVYTHPLWFGAMSLLFFVSRHMAWSAFGLSFACTAGMVYLLVRRIGGIDKPATTAMAIAILTASKAFTDYSTSGLENPLSHLLLLGFFARFWTDEDPDPAVAERQLSLTCMFGGLLVCNRLDLGLMLAPALVYALWPPRLSLRRVLAIGLGFAPLIVWELISLVYYGFLVPNTAYAKLGAKLPRELVLTEGSRYFANSLRWDPITLVAVAVITVVALAQVRGRPKQACAAVGVLLYLVYVLQVGGDYMSGRFFTAPLAVAAALLANQPKLPTWLAVAGSVVIVALAFKAPNPTVFNGPDYSKHNLKTDGHVDDERGYRHILTGLISERKGPFLANSTWYRKGKRHRKKAEEKGKTLVVVNGNGGYMGYAAGPQIHYINPYGITDPLLARLPGKYHAAGHIHRRPPPGYGAAALGEGPIKDPNLDAYWQDLALITRAPIWSRTRWAAIWRVHIGANQHLLDAWLATIPPDSKR